MVKLRLNPFRYGFRSVDARLACGKRKGIGTHAARNGTDDRGTGGGLHDRPDRHGGIRRHARLLRIGRRRSTRRSPAGVRHRLVPARRCLLRPGRQAEAQSERHDADIRPEGHRLRLWLRRRRGLQIQRVLPRRSHGRLPRPVQLRHEHPLRDDLLDQSAHQRVALGRSRERLFRPRHMGRDHALRRSGSRRRSGSTVPL